MKTVTVKVNSLKAFRITGWVQFGNDCASPVDRVQLALSPDGALTQVKAHYSSPEYRYALTAQEIK